MSRNLRTPGHGSTCALVSSLTINITGDPLKEARKDVAALNKASQRAATDAARRLQTVGREQLVGKAEVSKGSAVRRVRAYSNKVWFGTVPVVLTPPRLAFVPPPAKNRGQGLMIGGQAVKGFARPKGRYRNLPFRKQPDGKLMVLKRDIAEMAKEAWLATGDQAEDELERALRTRTAQAALRL